MKIDKFLELREQLLNEALAITTAKGKDYTKGSEDVLRNFKETGTDLGLSPEKVWGIFAKKHFDAIMSYIKHGGQSESEPIAERIKDLLNYLVLLYAILNEQPKNTKTKLEKDKAKYDYDEAMKDLEELFSNITFTVK